MLTVTHRPLTAHDYRELPEFGPRYQLIEGELHMAPAPNRFHQDILLRLGTAFSNHLEKQTTGRVYVAPFDVYLTDISVFQPDLCYFSAQRYAYLTDEGANGAPDLIIEILTPKTAKFDQGPKKEVYARTGVREYWIIDPAAKLIKIYDLGPNAETPRVTLDIDGLLTTSLLPGLSISLRALFAD